MSAQAPAPAGEGSHVLSTPLPASSSAGWTDDGPALGSTGTLLGAPSPQTPAQPLKMDFRVLLRQNKEAVERQLRDVSDPTSPHYGQYLTADQLRELVSPSLEDQARVASWLRKSLHLDHESVQPLGDYVVVKNAKPEFVRDTFGCTAHRFTEQLPQAAPNAFTAHPPLTPRVILRCVGSVTIPAQFAGLVTGTVGLVDFPLRIHGGPHPHPTLGPRDARLPVHHPPHGVAINQLNEQQQPEASQSEQQQAGADEPASIAASHAFHPHQTLRTTEQLNAAALQFEAEHKAK